MNAREGALARLRAYLDVPGDAVRLLVRGPEMPLLCDFAAAAPWLSLEAQSPVSHSSSSHNSASHSSSSHSAGLELRGPRPHGCIRFEGELEGRLVESLAETLRTLATGEIGWDTPATPALLADLPGMVKLRVYVGPHCPFCPSVAAAALRMACATPRIEVDIVRADQCQDRSITSVPTVTLDDALLSQGAIGEYELAERLLARQDPG